MPILRRAARQNVVQNRLVSMMVVMTLLGGTVFTATATSGQAQAQSGQPEIVGGDVVWQDLILDSHTVDPSTPDPSSTGRAQVAQLALSGSANCASVELPAPSSPVPVTGDVIWQTRGSQRIPVAFAEVCLFDDIGRNLGWSVTDKDGHFTIDVEAGRTGIFAMAYTSSGDGVGSGPPSVRVEKSKGGLYSLKSSQVVSTTRGAPRPLEVVASTDTVANRAFSVYQALVRGFYAFERWLPAGSALAPLHTYYPPPEDKTGTKYYPLSRAITVETDDEWDWDVLHHELAHHVGASTGLLPALGRDVDTSHLFADNLSGGARTLDDSMKLSWIEGWATYAAVSMQQRLKSVDPVLNDVPTFGNLIFEDNIYTGPQVRPKVRFALTPNVLDERTAPLPDNEVVVAQFLQSLDPYDARARRPTPLPWPVRDLAVLAKDGAVVDAFDAWNRLNARQKLDSCAATNFGLGPQLTSVGLDVSKGPHTITVAPNGPGPAYPNTTLTLTFLNGAGTAIKTITKNVDAKLDARALVEITISDGDWADLMSKGAKAWVLLGRQDGATGRYQIPGCQRKIQNGAVANLSVQSVCEAGVGALDGTLKNDGTETGQYVIAVNAQPTGVGAAQDNAISFERTVEPGGSATIKLGDLDDGAYVVTVATVADNGSGVVSAQQQTQVKCTTALGRDYERRVSCLASNGRVDAILTNIYSRTALYEVTVDQAFTRTLRINRGETQRTAITGLQDGKHSLRITRTQILDSGETGDTDQLYDEEFSVTCDGYFIGTDLVDIRAWCDNGQGRASIYAKNDELVGSDFVVTTGATAGAAQAVVPAGGTALLEFTELRNGKIEFIVKRNGKEIGRPGATIRCS